MKPAVDQIRRREGLRVAARGAGPLASADAGQAGLSRQTGDPLPAYADPRLHQLRVDAWCTVGAPTASVNLPHLPQQTVIRLRPRRAPPPEPRVEPARGDAEHPGHRGDVEHGLVRPHEPVDLLGLVSRANQAVAFARISRPSRRRRFSRRSLRSSSRSAVVIPSSRRPSSRSAWTTQLRIDCADGSNSRARWSGLRPDRTRSTIWRRNSAGYGALDLGIADTSSYKDPVSTNRVKLSSYRRQVARRPTPEPSDDENNTQRRKRGELEPARSRRLGPQSRSHAAPSENGTLDHDGHGQWMIPPRRGKIAQRKSYDGPGKATSRTGNASKRRKEANTKAWPRKLGPKNHYESTSVGYIATLAVALSPSRPPGPP